MLLFMAYMAWPNKVTFRSDPALVTNDFNTSGLNQSSVKRKGLNSFMPVAPFNRENNIRQAGFQGLCSMSLLEYFYSGYTNALKRERKTSPHERSECKRKASGKKSKKLE